MRNLETVKNSYLADSNELDFYGTINEDGTPHITLLTSLHVKDNSNFVWGEYSAGMSKVNQRERPKIGFLSIIDSEKVTRGKADWLYSKSNGEELDALNRIPQFRYNNVFGYSPVHILKNVELSEEDLLKRDELAASIKETKDIAAKFEDGGDPAAVSTVTREYLTTGNGIKVIGFIGKDGYPVIAPLPQAALVDKNGSRLVFLMRPYAEILNAVEEGAPIAILALNYEQMGTVLVEGKLALQNIDGNKVGALDIARVYNSMLPGIGYVYPPELAQIKTVTKFKNTLYEYNV